MKTCFVDYRINKKEEHILSSNNLKIIKVNKNPYLYDAINGHPDIQINILNNKNLIIAKNSLLNKTLINSKDLKIINSKSELKEKYPNNIFLNAVNLKNFFIHNLKYTDENLLNEVKEKTLINVKQGYTKCSCAIVNDNALMTSDIGIFNSLKPYPIDILYIPTGDITLLGLDYGFIGGTCGLISKDSMAFFGNLKYHSFGNDVIKFLHKHNVKPIFLSNNKLIDRGSILTLL
ncbi:DUF6873 family GME fold protein [Clostridium tarantellae]|uniref:DUF6873 domain-containing protein n=1 Tax=Clostridium tarantellae TaxID=39493 RepID=A0A6I1MQR1_9CLOT|nr:hypothetical protein [Clostridium tarantellae]MPQ42639.1 hypothetical protein [Clostridium tarantellae]